MRKWWRGVTDEPDVVVVDERACSDPADDLLERLEDLQHPSSLDEYDLLTVMDAVLEIRTLRELVRDLQVEVATVPRVKPPPSFGI